MDYVAINVPVFQGKGCLSHPQILTENCLTTSFCTISLTEHMHKKKMTLGGLFSLQPLKE